MTEDIVVEWHLRSDNINFPGGLDGEESTCNVGDPGSMPELERHPGERNGNSLQYPCQENSMD